MAQNSVASKALATAAAIALAVGLWPGAVALAGQNGDDAENLRGGAF